MYKQRNLIVIELFIIPDHLTTGDSVLVASGGPVSLALWVTPAADLAALPGLGKQLAPPPPPAA